MTRTPRTSPKTHGSPVRKKQPSRRGHIFVFGVSAACLIGAGGLATYTVAVAERKGITPFMVVDQLPDHVVLASALLSAGIAPEALAVAGLTTDEATLVIDAALEAARPRLIQIRTALENKHTAQKRVTQLRRQAGASQSEIVIAKEAVVSTTQTHDALISLVEIPAVARFDDAQRRRFLACHTNASQDMPLKYGAFGWSSQEASAIAQASRQKTACEARGEDLDPESAAILSRADANADVAVAHQTIETRLDDIQAVWDLAVREDE